MRRRERFRAAAVLCAVIAVLASILGLGLQNGAFDAGDRRDPAELGEADPSPHGEAVLKRDAEARRRTQPRRTEPTVDGLLLTSLVAAAPVAPSRQRLSPPAAPPPATSLKYAAFVRRGPPPALA